MIAIARRVLLFIVVNALVVLSISIILNLLGVQPYLTNQGIDPVSLAIFCVLWGSIGSFIALMMSKKMALWSSGVKLIDPNTRDPEARKILDMVYALAKQAGLPKMPEVGVYVSPELNAFATGPTKSDSLVAISSGLLQKMDRKEVEAVLGHEISHVANGDMVTMTLIQGIVNAFVLFLARILAFAFSGREGRGSSFFMIFILQNVFMFLGALVVAAFSRWRELRADIGGAYLAGRNNMIDALRSLQKNIHIQDPRQDQSAFRNMKISVPSAMAGLFSSHPPLEKRIERLQERVDIH